MNSSTTVPTIASTTYSGGETPSMVDVRHGKALAQFRKNLGEYGKDETDRSLTKWLKAKKYNADEATKMYQNSLEMKQKFGVDNILETYEVPEVHRRFFPWGIVGFDKEGCPISVELLGRIDFKGLMRSIRKSDLEKTCFWKCETYLRMCREQSEKLGKVVDTVTVIVDMKDCDRNFLWMPGMKWYSHLLTVMESNYPGLFKKLYAINSPKTLSVLWMLSKPFVPKSLKKREHFLTSNYQKHLLKAIDPDQLPACFGGTLTDPDGDPWCKTIIPPGGKVPQEYYLKNTVDVHGLNDVWIEPSRLFVVDLDVQVTGTVIKWEFYTKEHQIGFAVLLKSTEEGEKDQEVVPLKRYNCEQNIEDGFYVCDEIGKYVVVFDNSFSWARWKHLYYCVTLLLCDKETEEDLNEKVLKSKTVVLQPSSTDSINRSQLSVNVESIVRIDCGRKCTSLIKIDEGEPLIIKTTRMDGGDSQPFLLSDDKLSVVRTSKTSVKGGKCCACFY